MSVRSLALKAGVSAMTVSLALRNHPSISRRTRDRIRALAKRVGHVPNPRLGELMNEVRRGKNPALHASLGMIALYPVQEPARLTPHLADTIRGARNRAVQLGYRIDDFWLGAPGMTPRRMRGILETRGILGLLCLGSYDPDALFPGELDRFSVVTLGMTVNAELHRVASYHHHDALVLLQMLHGRGYRRPGLIMHPEWEPRTGYGYTSAALLFQERFLGGIQVPSLRLGSFDAAAVRQWQRAHQPDVIVLHEPAPFFRAFEDYLQLGKVRVPRDLGVAFIGVDAGSRFYAGIEQDHELIGLCGTELLVSRVHQRDFGLPKVPKIEFVEGRLVEGASLRRR